MKKKLLLLIISIMLCLSVFVGCTMPQGIIFSSPKWLDNEELVYKVSTKEDGTKSETPIIVGTGTYTSKTSKVSHNGHDAFKLETVFSFTGKYVSKTFSGNTFTDTINTSCTFYNHNFNYLPITSTRTASITNLKIDNDNKYTTSKLEYKTTSNSTFKEEKLVKIESTLFGKNNKTGLYDTPLTFSNDEKEIQKETNYTYENPAENKALFDNENLYYGIRSLLSPSFTGQSISLNTPFDGQITRLYLNKSTDENEGINKKTGLIPVKIDDKIYNSMLFTLSGGKNVSGIPIKLYFENEYGYKKDDVTYKRNVLVKIIQGNLIFELTTHPEYEKI